MEMKKGELLLFMNEFTAYSVEPESKVKDYVHVLGMCFVIGTIIVSPDGEIIKSNIDTSSLNEEVIEGLASGMQPFFE